MCKCQKENFNGSCCCNCENHLKDYHHCTTNPKPEGVDGCVCSVQKGWICKITFPDTNETFYHSGWPEHGLCEMHILKK